MALTAQHQVLVDAEVLEDLSFLRYVGYAVTHDLVGATPGLLGAVEQYGASVGPHEAYDGLHRGRAPRAVAADHAHDFSGIDVETDAMQDAAPPVAGMKISNLQDHAACSVPR